MQFAVFGPPVGARLFGHYSFCATGRNGLSYSSTTRQEDTARLIWGGLGCSHQTAPNQVTQLGRVRSRTIDCATVPCPSGLITTMGGNTAQITWHGIRVKRLLTVGEGEGGRLPLCEDQSHVLHFPTPILYYVTIYSLPPPQGSRVRKMGIRGTKRRSRKKIEIHIKNDLHKTQRNAVLKSGNARKRHNKCWNIFWGVL